MYILKEQRYSKSETTIKLRKERPMRKKVYAAWILAIIMVMSGVLCAQAETVSTGKTHGSKVNTTGETTPTEAEKQFEEAEQIHVTVRYSSDWEYSEYSYSSDYGSYVELSIPDDGIYVRINASINTPLDYASELYDFGINAYDVIVEDSCETVSIGGMEFVQGENDYYKAFFGYDQESAMYAKIMVYGDPEDHRVTELIDNVTFHKKEYTKTKTPWYWDGEVYVPKDTEPVQVGNFTVEAEYLPIDTVYPTFNNGYSKVAKSGGWYYVLTDGDVSEYSDEDGGLAYEGDVYFDFDVENIFGDEDGNLYALGNGGPLVQWGTEEDEVLLNYCVMVSLHPSGKKAVGWSYSNSITEYDFETGTNKERVIDPVEGINSVSVTKDYQAVCGYKESETLLNIYDNNWNEVMTISSTDTESGMLEGVSAFEQTQNGWVIFDSWMENVIFVGFDGAILKEVSYEELFGTLNWPYVNGTCMDEEGNVIVAITDQREDASCYETIIFKLKGF